MEWQTIAREIGYSCEGFDIVSEQVELPDGERAAFDYLDEGESVVVLPFTADGEVVVIDEWRHAVNRLNRGLPAGSVEPGESLSAAADRELREETGYEAAELERMASVEPANGFANALFHYYVARGCERAREQSLDRDESIAVETTTFEALLDAVRDDELRDGRAAFAVVRYLLFDGRC